MSSLQLLRLITNIVSLIIMTYWFDALDMAISDIDLQNRYHLLLLLIVLHKKILNDIFFTIR